MHHVHTAFMFRSIRSLEHMLCNCRCIAEPSQFHKLIVAHVAELPSDEQLPSRGGNGLPSLHGKPSRG